MSGPTDGESRRHSQLQGHVEARIASGAELDAREIVNGVSAFPHQVEDAAQAVAAGAGDLQDRTRDESEAGKPCDVCEEAILVTIDVIEWDVEKDLTVPARPISSSTGAPLPRVAVFACSRRHCASGTPERLVRFSFDAPGRCRRCEPPLPRSGREHR